MFLLFGSGPGDWTFSDEWWSSHQLAICEGAASVRVRATHGNKHRGASGSFMSLVFSLLWTFLLVWLLGLPVTLRDSVSWVLCKCGVYRSQEQSWASGWEPGQCVPPPRLGSQCLSLCWRWHCTHRKRIWGSGCAVCSAVLSQRGESIADTGRIHVGPAV